DLVIEAVVEDLELKRKVFRDLEAHTRPETLLATNTSSLGVANVQQGLAHPERVAALHFFNPVHKMPLVEVAHAPATTRPAVASRFPPNPAFEALAQRGLLGQKSKNGGFYTYARKKKRVNAAAVAVVRQGQPKGRSLLASLPPVTQQREATERLVLLMVNEA